MAPFAPIENAVLIYGPRKSGTTLLQRLLDGSDLYVYPTELKLKRYARAAWYSRSDLARRFDETSLLLQREYPRFQSDRYRKLTREAVAIAASLRDVVLADVQNSRRLLPRR